MSQTHGCLYINMISQISACLEIHKNSSMNILIIQLGTSMTQNKYFCLWLYNYNEQWVLFIFIIEGINNN